MGRVVGGKGGMTRLFEWLLGLERVRLGADAPLSLRFATAPAAWIMLIGAVIAVVLVFRLYRRQRVPSGWRWALMALRFCVIMTGLFMIGRPMVVLQRNEVEPSVVAVMVDSSASMATDDGPLGASRWHGGGTALFSTANALIPSLLGRHEAEVWTFDSAATRIGRASSMDGAALLMKKLEESKPAGRASDLASSVLQVLEATRGVKLAGLVVVSDGRQTALGALETALASADARGVSIHSVAVGSEAPKIDAEASSVHAAEDAFVQDLVRVQVQLEFRGLAESTPFSLELRDKATGEVLSSRRAEAEGDTETWRGDLTYRPTSIGRRILTAGVAPLTGEENTSNNTIELSITAHDTRLSVLYVEDQPRYEYRYLKNMLIRERTLESSCLLLSATAGFTQEGTRPIAQFPRSEEELGRYDVVILGDVDPRGDWLSPAQETLLVDHVSQRGGGLAFVAGERYMPHRLRGTKLEKLLPVRLLPNFNGPYEGTYADPFIPRLTAEGRESRLFAWDESGGTTDLVSSMPGWFWFASVKGSQPGATVLATHPSARAGEEDAPLAVLGRHGVGRTFYLGSDDLWRWRQYAGEGYYNHLWLQIIRTLGRGRRFGADRGWRIETDRRRYELGREVRVELVAGSGRAQPLPPRPTILATDLNDQPVARIELSRGGTDLSLATGVLVPARTGVLSLAVEGVLPADAGAPAPRTIEVFAMDRERGRTEADPSFLRTISEASGGTFRRIDDDLSDLAAAIPDRSVQIAADVEESIWDTRLMLILFTALIATEWVIRKAIGLN